MNAEEYWRSQALSATQESEQLCQSYRDEIEALQRRVNSLLHERSFMKAATATDVRNFCLNFQADQQRKRGLTTASAVEDIPIHTLLQFLHTYSNGLLPAPENRRKRGRTPLENEEGTQALTVGRSQSNAAAGPSVPPHAFLSHVAASSGHSRRFQRMLARHRITGRYEDYEEQQQQQQPAGEGERANLQYRDPNAGDGGSGGGGGPVISATTFGLPANPFPQ